MSLSWDRALYVGNVGQHASALFQVISEAGFSFLKHFLCLGFEHHLKLPFGVDCIYLNISLRRRTQRSCVVQVTHISRSVASHDVIEMHARPLLF